MTVGIDLRESPVAIGSMVSKYRVESVVGRGGYAWVFRATDTFLGREVAIKILHRRGGVTPEMLRRGQAEARLLVKLRHPNIVETFDAGMTDDGLLFIVMELLVGRSLFAVLSELGRLTEHEAVPLFAQVTEAVAHAHSIGAIHRDLKPENIFVTESGDAKVLDFGIAKITDDGVPITTKKDVWLGTVLYMSPEQVQGGHVSFGSDIYSLGMVYWEVLGGMHPFLTDCKTPTPVVMGMMHVTTIPPPIHKFRTDVPKELSRIIDRAISKKVEERFLSAAEFAVALRAYQQQRALQLGDAKPNVRKLAGAAAHGAGAFAPVPLAVQLLPSGHSKSPPPSLAETAPVAIPAPAPADSAPTKEVVKRTLKGMGAEAKGMAQLPVASPVTTRVGTSSPVPEPTVLMAHESSPPQGTPPAMSRRVAPRSVLPEPTRKPPVKRLGWFQAMLIGGCMGAAAFGAATIGMYSVKAKRAHEAVSKSVAAPVEPSTPAAPDPPTPIDSSPRSLASVVVEPPPATQATSVPAARAAVAPRPASKARKRDRLDDKFRALEDELSNSRTIPTSAKAKNDFPD